MKSVLLVQPYVPSYRVPFFVRATALLEQESIRLVLAAGEPGGAQAKRGDSYHLPGQINTRSYSIRLCGAVVRTQVSWRHWRGADALVFEASGGLLDTSLALTFSRRPVGVWGHIDAYVSRESHVDRMIETWQLRRAAMVFAYTDRGASVALQRGVSPQKVVTLNNTVLTERMRGDRADLDATSADALLGNYGFDPTKTFTYIGGLDDSKRVDFLADVLDLLWVRRPELRVFVGGRGHEAGLLEDARARGQAVMLGVVNDRLKAALAHRSSAILMPGRVGLVAVESLALGLPIVTTDWPFHAPEFDYLTPGEDVVVTQDDVTKYADAVIRLSESPDDVAKLRERAQSKSGWPDIDHMAETFAEGVCRMVTHS